MLFLTYMSAIYLNEASHETNTVIEKLSILGNVWKSIGLFPKYHAKREAHGKRAVITYFHVAANYHHARHSNSHNL